MFFKLLNAFRSFGWARSAPLERALHEDGSAHGRAQVH